MFIKESVWNELSKIEKNYIDLREQNLLERRDVTSHKTAFQSVLLARTYKLNELMSEGEDVENERYECAFLYTLLENGWTVADMEAFAHLNEMIVSQTNEKFRAFGEELIEELSKTKINTVEKRFDLMRKCVGYIFACGKDPAEYEKLVELFSKAMDMNLNFSEYPDDPEFLKQLDKKGKFDPHRIIGKGHPIDEYEELYKSSMRHANLSDEVKQKIRDREHYVIKEKTDDELEKFNITEGHKKHKITKSTRNAIKEVYGDDIYDDIDEMSKGDEADRTVKIHHALGNKFIRKGEEVLELDYAGSGFKEARREYHGQHGKRFSDGTRSSDESILSEFGPLVKKGKTTFKYLRAKTTKVELKDKKMEKTRYTIAGPSPENGGFWNFGEYSIESTREYGKDFSAAFLSEIFEKWNKKQESPHNVHINITGHSRGAVAAGECVRLVAKWMRDYAKEHPEAKNYDKNVMFDMLLRDPVPGMITSWFFGSQDYRKIPNANVTVFCSMGQEHSDLAFPLQDVRGQKRLIIGMTGHDMDLGNIDFSQRVHSDDGLAHKEGFYDAETGEIFRGSGVAEMPEGVYITDDKFNMIRITSYSQVSKLINSVYAGKSMQSRRVAVIQNMARNWFVDNELKMGFANEDDYEDARVKNEENVEKILATNNKRIAPVRDAVKALKLAEKQGASIQELIKIRSDIIKLGKKYMAKTKLPNSGDSQYRMDLVSDIVTFTMREKNYLTREFNLDNGKDVEGRALDEKIRAHKERLEKKPGALERKLEKEQKRLTKDKSSADIINQTKMYCETAERTLNEMRKNKAKSESYNNFIDVIKEGKNLSADMSINSFKNYLTKLSKVSEQYKKKHSTPDSDEGKLTLKFSEGFMDMSKKAFDSFDKSTNYIVDKNKSLNSIIEGRNKKIGELEKKLPQKPEINKEIENNIKKKINKSVKHSGLKI